MTEPTPVAAARSKRRWPLLLAAGIVALIALFVLYTGLAFSWSYSEGERAGQLRKLSKRGWVCKTWEGEMAVALNPQMAPEIWDFTVREERIVKQMNNALGKNVTLHYEEHPGIPTSCFGDTRYFVDSVYVHP